MRGKYMNIIEIILNDDSIMCTLDEKNERLKICQSCSLLQNDICEKCGCLIDVRASYKDADCPMGKWHVNTL